MAESKIVNESSTTFAPALAYRSAVVSYTKRNYMMQVEAEKQGIDWSSVSKPVQRQSNIETAQGIRSTMNDPTDVGEFVSKMFSSPTGVELYEVKIVSSSPERVDMEYHYCPLVQAWKSMNLSDEEISKLCDSGMAGDMILAEEMGYDLEVQKAIAKGDPVCKMIYSRKKGK